MLNVIESIGLEARFSREARGKSTSWAVDPNSSIWHSSRLHCQSVGETSYLKSWVPAATGGRWSALPLGLSGLRARTALVSFGEFAHPFITDL